MLEESRLAGCVRTVGDSNWRARWRFAAEPEIEKLVHALEECQIATGEVPKDRWHLAALTMDDMGGPMDIRAPKSCEIVGHEGKSQIEMHSVGICPR
jgi:hypothetical protein